MNDTQSESIQQVVEPKQPTGIARRRLLRAGMAAAPVVLALSGRSAMAGVGDPCAKGLSPLAWNSLAPDGSICKMNSHLVTPSRSLGNNPSYWKDHTTNTPGTIGKTYFKAIFTSSDNSNKIYRILDTNIGSNVISNNLDAHFCVAYCNASTYPGDYAISVDELKTLYSTGKLAPTSSITLSSSQIMAFLAQTWGG